MRDLALAPYDHTPPRVNRRAQLEWHATLCLIVSGCVAAWVMIAWGFFALFALFAPVNCA